jgi:hypothetical protein
MAVVFRSRLMEAGALSPHRFAGGFPGVAASLKWLEQFLTWQNL